MLNLDTTTALLRLVTSSTADIEVQASYVDYTSPSTFASAGQNTIIVTATTTTIVGSPAASTTRNIKGVTIKNEHASTANTITVEHTDGTTVVTIFKATLQAGECMVLDANGVWFVYDSSGGVKMGNSAASDTLPGLIQIALQSDMEAASSNILAVPPGRLHFHPGVVKFWVQVTGGATPAIVTSYNVTSITDTGVGRLTVTIATDFSTANWCCIATTFTTTTTGDEGICNIDAKAAGTCEIGNRIITPAFADPNVGYDVAGLGDQ